MSSYILCQTRRAAVPFYIKNISTNIYSLEELCYYLHHNPYLVDRTIINNSLCSWLENELWLTGLAAKIRQNLGKFSDPQDVLYPIFKEINYLTYEELKELNATLSRMNRQKPEERTKEKADSLVDNGMYVSAIHVYQDLLTEMEKEKTEESETDEQKFFCARVQHNLGCAYANLFQMEKAMDHFEEAFRLSGREEDLMTYLLCYRGIRTPVEYNSRLEELSVTEELRKRLSEELNRFAGLPEQQVYSQHVDALIGKMTKEYHRSTGS